MADLPDQVRLLVRLDASHHTGLGHAARVAELLRRVSLPLDVHLCGCGDQLGTCFSDNVTMHILEDRYSEAEKTDQFLKLAGEIKADILMIDQPDQTLGTWSAYHNSPFPVIAIDDYGGDVQADLLFNGTIIEAYHHYPLISDRARIFCGGSYALINPAFGQLPRKLSGDKTLLVVIGGGDRARRWAFLLTGDQSPFSGRDDKITMIVGATFADSAELSRRCARLEIDMEQNITQERLAGMLCSHSAALVTGGMIVYETLACGCPAIIFPQEENLIREAEWFGGRNAVINLGYDGGMDMKRVKKALDMKGASPVCGKIDGNGMIRVAAEIDSFVRTIIPAWKTS